MSEQTANIIEKFQSIINSDLSALEFWQEFEQDDIQEEPFSVNDLIAELPETLSSEKDIEQLREFALNTMELCRKKRELLSAISENLKNLDGI